MLNVQPPHETYGLQGVALVYAVLMLTSNAILTSTTSITVPLTDYYGISSEVVAEMPNLLFGAVYLVVGVAATWITRRLTLSYTLCIAALLMTLGSLFRATSATPDGFVWLMTGNALVAVAQPLIFANTSGVALQCVGVSRQGIYIGAVLLCAVVGNAYGYVISSWLVQSAADYGRFFVRIEFLYLILNLTSTVVLGLICVQRARMRHRAGQTVRDRATAALVFKDPNDPLLGEFALNRRRLLLALAIASVLNGTTNSVIVLLEFILLARGYTASTVFVTGVCYLCASIPAPWLVGWWLDHTRHDRAIVTCTFLGTALLQIAVVNGDLSLAAFYAVVTLYGVGGNVISTVFLATANRWTSGEHADEINAVYTWLHNLVTLALALAFTLAPAHLVWSLFFIVSIVCAAASLAFPVLNS